MHFFAIVFFFVVQQYVLVLPRIGNKSLVAVANSETYSSNSNTDPEQRITIPTIPSVVTGVTQPLNQLVLQSFENWRSIMLKGDNGNGIPILDPFVVPFNIPISFPNPINQNLGYYTLVLSKLTFTGLSTFNVKSIDVEPTSMTFEDYIGNMSASCGYSLNYYLSSYFQTPIPICSGSAYGALYGTDIIGSGSLFPTPGDWFAIAQLTMTFSFENLDIRIYPTLPLVEPNTEQQISNTIYNAIQEMKPNISDLTRMTYSKTVELNLS